MSVKGDLGCLAASAPIVISVWAFFALVVYGIVVIIFRYAFGVYLWNPFG